MFYAALWLCKLLSASFLFSLDDEYLRLASYIAKSISVALAFALTSLMASSIANSHVKFCKKLGSRREANEVIAGGAATESISSYLEVGLDSG